MDKIVWLQGLRKLERMVEQYKSTPVKTSVSESRLTVIKKYALLLGRQCPFSVCDLCDIVKDSEVLKVSKYKLEVDYQ